MQQKCNQQSEKYRDTHYEHKLISVLTLHSFRFMLN